MGEEPLWSGEFRHSFRLAMFLGCERLLALKPHWQFFRGFMQTLIDSSRRRAEAEVGLKRAAGSLKKKRKTPWNQKGFRFLNLHRLWFHCVFPFSRGKSPTEVDAGTLSCHFVLAPMYGSELFVGFFSIAS